MCVKSKIRISLFNMKYDYPKKLLCKNVLKATRKTSVFIRNNSKYYDHHLPDTGF